MWRSNSSVSSRSSVNLPDNVVNSEHYSVEGDSSFDFKNWSIPRVPDKEVYKTSWFKSSFRAKYAVKTVEQTIPISNRNEDFELFNKRFVNQSLAKGFKFLHIGAVQVAVKPLTRIGIDASVLMCLRDARFIDFRTSTLGMVHTSLYNGLVYFDTFPNITLSLSDVNISKALTLNVLTSGYDMLIGSQPVVIIYRIYYKLLKTNLNPQAVIKNSGESTLLIQSSTRDANILIPRMMKWSEITLPNEWLIENVTQPAKVAQNDANVDYIQQYMDGSVKISFVDLNLSRTKRPLPNERRNSFSANQRRNSFADSTTTEGFQRRDKDIENFLADSVSADYKLKGVATSSQVCSAFYSAKQSVVPSQASQAEEGDISPSASDLNAPMPEPVFHHCNAITFPEPKKMGFNDLDWSSLEKDFRSEENRQKRIIYFKSFSQKEQDLLKLQWVEKMLEEQRHTLFFDFLLKIKPGILNVVKKPFVLAEDNNVVKDSHPPVETLRVKGKDDTVVIASPYKTSKNDPAHSETRKIIEQNNFANQSLHIIGQQLDRIEEKIDSSSAKIIEKPIPLAVKKDVEKPLISLPEERR